MDNDQLAVICFPHYQYFAFGLPNDEALGGHPLAERGLEFYSVHEIAHSSLIETLERRNSVHPNHDREKFLLGTKHYIFTFHDSTLECVFTENEWWKPTVKIFDSESDAEREFRSPSKL
jgi:hypothetical protein